MWKDSLPQCYHLPKSTHHDPYVNICLTCTLHTACTECCLMLTILSVVLTHFITTQKCCIAFYVHCTVQWCPATFTCQAIYTGNSNTSAQLNTTLAVQVIQQTKQTSNASNCFDCTCSAAVAHLLYPLCNQTQWHIQ